MKKYRIVYGKVSATAGYRIVGQTENVTDELALQFDNFIAGQIGKLNGREVRNVVCYVFRFYINGFQYACFGKFLPLFNEPGERTYSQSDSIIFVEDTGSELIAYEAVFKNLTITPRLG